MNQIFPTLYKKTQTGAIQQWIIGVEDATICTVHGQVGGAMQTTSDTIKEGKNLGRANATTPASQALAEAQAKWDKQKKKGYVEDVDTARAGKVDKSVVLGGIEPMLSISKSHPNDPILDKYLKYPCMEQPKLDGVRCIAMIDGSKVTLWSRQRRPRTSMPHIVEELERLFPGQTLILDGELYNHDYRYRFQDLISIITADEPDEEGLHKVVQLHVYDLPNCGRHNVAYGTPYEKRYRRYLDLLMAGDGEARSQVVVPVVGHYCRNESELLACYEARLLAGYEGSMAKNLDAGYQGGKRSHEILKMKEFVEGEIEIIEVLDGKGKDFEVASKIRGWFTPPDGRPRVIVEPGTACSYKQKKRWWERREELKGKLATIKYKRLTDAGIPYIPAVKGIRDYE